MVQRRDRGREVFWREQVHKQKISGLSVRAFCQANDLSEASFYAWRRTLQLREAEAKTPEFVPLQVTTMLPTSPGLIVELRGGRQLRVPEMMPVERLVALLRGLEASEVSS
jgi:hypothetical protein